MVQSQESGGILKENYQPATYKGNAPEPLPKVSEELPWEKVAKKEEEVKEKVDEKLDQAEDKKQELEEKTQSGGTVSSIVGAATDLLSKVTNTVGHSLHQITKDAIEKLEDVQKTRLHDRFPLDKGESLMYEYTCYISSGDETCAGYLYVTTEHIGFWSDFGDYKMKLWFPLDNIVSLQPGTALTKKDGKSVFIQRVESEDVNCDAILLYTKDNEIHKFYKFGAAHDPIMSYWSHAWNVIDHAWRDSTEELKEGKKALTKKDEWAESLNKQEKKDKSSKDSGDQFSKESSKDFSQDFSKDYSKDSTFKTSELSTDYSKDNTSKVYSKDLTSKDYSKDFSSKDSSKDFSSDSSKGFSTDYSKDSSSKDYSKDFSKDYSKEISSKDFSSDYSKDITSKDYSKDSSSSKDYLKDITSKDYSKDITSKDYSKDFSTDYSKDITSKDYSKDSSSKDYSKDFSTDYSKDTSKSDTFSSGTGSGINTGISGDRSYASVLTGTSGTSSESSSKISSDKTSGSNF